MDSSARLPSLNSAYTRATTFFQFISSVVAAVSSASSPPAPIVTVLVPVPLYVSVPSSSDSMVVSTSSSAAVSADASTLLAYSSYPLIQYALIIEGPLERLLLSLQTAHSILFSVGTEFYTWNGLTDRGA